MGDDNSSEHLEEAPASAPIDSLTITFVPGVTLTKWTRAWAERNTDVPLTVAEVSESEQAAALHDGTAQLAFVRLPLDDDGLNVIPLYREVAVAFASKDHAIAAADSLTLADLQGESVRTGSSFGRADFDLIAAGVGILIVPHSIARRQNRKDLVARPVTDAAETQIAVAWRAGEQSDLVASRIEEFIGIVRGRTARSSRSQAVDEAPPPKRTAAAKAAAKAAAAAKAGTKSGSASGGGQSKRPTPARGASFAQQRKNDAARKKHRGR
ncbi:MAG: LysR family substrate-binding domain-containing protein [Lacisediminihabitans sp.]